MTPRGTLAVAFWRIAILAALLAFWQWGFALGKAGWPVPRLIDPYFISQPSEIWRRLLQLGCLADRKDAWLLGADDGFLACLAAHDNNLWYATLVTLENTFWGFVTGVASGVLAGLVLGRSE